MKTLKKWIVDLFYIPKYEKVSDKSFSRILLSSIFGAFICVFCLAGLTWAWFTSSVSSNANTISAAKFDVEIIVKDNSGTEVTPNSDGSYSLENSSSLESAKYSVTVKATGDASTGYCKIVLNGQVYHSIQLFPAGGEGKPQTVSFTVNVSSACTLTITPQWGSYTGNKSVSEGSELTVSAENSVSNQQNLLLVENTETSADTTTIVTSEGETTYALTDTEQLYTVQAGDTLAGIAKRYGTTTAVLSAYNGIQNTSYIQAGATLKIPPFSYTVPAGADPEQPADNPEPVESTSEQAAATPEPVESTAEAAESPEATTSSASTDPEPISE